MLGHEASHIADGDMAAMTLLQGVLNTFAMFFARVIAFAIDGFLLTLLQIPKELFPAA